MGALADLVVWNTDLHAGNEAELAEARPAATVLAGSVVYAHAASNASPVSASVAAATDALRSWRRCM